MVNINNYYRKKVKPEELLMPSSYHKPGMLCAGKISGEWTRGEIVYKTRTYIKVFFFDYGTNAYLAENDVKFLLEIFTELPKQAIRGCLSNVRPVGGGRLWDLKITEKFLRMVTDTVIWAKVVRLMTDNTLEIVIVDTNQKLCNLQNLSNLLVTKGLAEFHLSFEQLEQKVENFGPYCQHYPSFELLETSNYPSYSDRWYALHEKGLDLNFLEETNFITLSSDKALTDPAIQKMLKLPEMKEIRESLIFNGVLSKEQE